MGFLMEFLEAVFELKIGPVTLEELLVVGVVFGLVAGAWKFGPAVIDKIFKK